MPTVSVDRGLDKQIEWCTERYTQGLHAVQLMFRKQFNKILQGLGYGKRNLLGATLRDCHIVFSEQCQS